MKTCPQISGASFSSLPAIRALLPVTFVLFICLLAFSSSAQTARAATRTVDNASDAAALTACTAAANDCSLRGAITGAITGDTIDFGPAFVLEPQIISLSNGQITINKNLTVTGPGADLLTVRNTAAVSSTSRVFNLTAGTISLSGMTISGGNVAGDGGGIFNTAEITLTRVIVTGNTAAGFGGGLESSNNLTVINSTISANRANSTGGGGGGIDHFGGTLTITNSTISGNSTPSSTNNQAGGVGTYSGSGVITITNSTITNNDNGGGTGASGMLVSGTLRNNIVAGNVGNTISPDINSPVDSAGNNLIGNPGASTGLTNGVNGDQVGTAAAPLNPQLAPLGYYGGGILTHALLSSGTASTAINAGTATGAPATDSRGAARSGTVDIGAFEVNAGFAAALPNGRVKVAYDQTITPASGAFVYAQLSGTLPPGLTLTPGAPNVRIAVQGTPTAAGTYSFAISITNGGRTTTIPYTITVIAPTAADSSISGRVLAGGKGLANARVEVTGTGGITKTVLTNSFGNFTIGDVEAGATYVINVSAKRYTFAPQVVSLTDSISEMTFTAQ